MRTDGMPIDASSSRAVSMAKRSLSATVIGKRDDMGVREMGAQIGDFIHNTPHAKGSQPKRAAL